MWQFTNGDTSEIEVTQYWNQNSQGSWPTGRRLLCFSECTYNDVAYKHGETWKPYGNRDPCFQCTCVKGDIDCTTLSCPPLLCDSAVAEVGECCPKCQRKHIYFGLFLSLLFYPDARIYVRPTIRRICRSCSFKKT